MIKDDKKRVMVTLTKEVFEAFEELTKQTGLNKSGLVTVWINANRKENEQKK